MAAQVLVSSVTVPPVGMLSCFRCRRPFDPADSEWCSCLATERTLKCPHCASCFCAAPPSYKSGFWSSAPKALWDRKFSEHRGHTMDADVVLRRPLVLVADDEPAIRTLAVRIIRGLGYGIVTASNGEEAFELALLHHPELVLTDALMPKLDGRDLCLRLKRDFRTSRIPVVVMTALYTALPYRLEAHKVFRVDGFLNKPLDPSTLATALKTYLPMPMAVGA